MDYTIHVKENDCETVFVNFSVYVYNFRGREKERMRNRHSDLPSTGSLQSAGVLLKFP